MRMNRRNVLAGIGALTAGGGAIFGSGAFSQAQAERTATIETSPDDDGAFLALDASDSTNLVTQTNNMLELSFGDLNENAKTTVEPGFTIKNNGGNDVGVKIEALTSNDSGESSGISFESNSNDDDLSSYPSSGNDHNLEADSGSVTVDIILDTRDDNDPTSVETIRITADDGEYSSSGGS